MTLQEALRLAKTECKDPYAQSYLKAIPDAIEMGAMLPNQTAMSGLKLQLLYALNNMRSWKGEIAREAKIIIKKFATSKG